MPRFIVERTFNEGLHIPMNADGVKVACKVIDCNADHGVTWIHSYVSDDKAKTFCVYDGLTPESIRLAAEQTGLPVDRVTMVTVLDPYFYTSD